MVGATGRTGGRHWVTAMLALAVWALACGDGAVEPTPADTLRPATVTVTPGTAGLAAPGATVQLTAEVRDQLGQVMEGSAVAWTTSDPSVATVDASGLVKAVAQGPAAANITVAAGGASATVQLFVADPQFAVLTALYVATEGDHWDRNDGWLESHDLRTWHGVTTDNSGRVTGLDLPDNGLTGRIPSELGDLEHLQVLTLDRNDLSGPIPPELGRLANLQHLDLGSNHLTGPIPGELGNLRALEILNLDRNALSGSIPPELGDLADLKHLDLGSNDLTGPIPGELDNLESLTLLHLDGNSLTGRIPSELAELAD